MRGTWMLSWILIICLSQVAVQSQYYSETLPYHPRPVKVTNLNFFMHRTTGVTIVQLSKRIFKGRTRACGGRRKRTIHDGKRDCTI
ncbi:hypothetical protein Goklo_012953 [Gossypium klotzschianum]|uniref:Secreted protein n=1 Tax=Gossypium klotzschianum TaxID=34286 RepID=A0A7J8VE07_9ROSI|nr:hypothetical protein [Gossypium klotzschianum]